MFPCDLLDNRRLHMPKVTRFTALCVILTCRARMVFKSQVTGAINYSFMSESLVK